MDKNVVVEVKLTEGMKRRIIELLRPDPDGVVRLPGERRFRLSIGGKEMDLDGQRAFERIEAQWKPGVSLVELWITAEPVD